MKLKNIKIIKNPYTDKMTAIEVPNKYSNKVYNKIESEIGEYFGIIPMKNTIIFYPVISKDTDDIINTIQNKG